jgi:hypothetical protein
MSRRSKSDTLQLQRPGLSRRHSMPSLRSRRKTKTAPSLPKAMNRKSATEREVSDGYCPTCGIQLCKISTRFWRRINKRKSQQPATPLHIPGRVENGRCLACEEPICDQPLPPPPPLKRQVNFVYQEPEEEIVHETTTSTLSTMNAFVYEGEYNVYGERHGLGQVSSIQ